MAGQTRVPAGLPTGLCDAGLVASSAVCLICKGTSTADFLRAVMKAQTKRDKRDDFQRNVWPQSMGASLDGSPGNTPRPLTDDYLTRETNSVG